MTSYRELRRRILSILSQPPYRYNVPYLSRLLGVDRTLVHKLARQLEQKGLVKREKFDGLTWLSLKHKTLYETLKWDVEFYTRKRQNKVDLIKYKRVSQTVMKELGKEELGNNHGFLTTSSIVDAANITSVGKSLVDRCPTVGKVGIGSRPNFPKKLGTREPGTTQHKIKWPTRAHWARIQAFRILVRRRQLTLDDWVMLNKLFNAYLSDTSQRVVILLDEVSGETIWLPYKHRFTKPGIKRLLDKFHHVFNNADKYKFGVFITLTVDPKKYPNMIVARYELQKAWNRMMSYFKKKLGKRPAFIRIIEFTKKRSTGLIHYHVLLLGVRRLMAKDRYEARLPKPINVNGRMTSTVWASTLQELYDRIKKYGFKPEEVKVIDHGESLRQLLEKWGFGKVHDIKYVINFNGRWMTFNFYRALSSNHDGGGIRGIRNLRGYLKKYLTKAFNQLDLDMMRIDAEQAVPLTLYWALNTRFFTYSKNLKPEKEPILTSKLVIGDHEYGYRFLGSGYIVNPELLPLITDEPPWKYHIPYTYPPLYDPREVI